MDQPFKEGDNVVYRAHGIGKILGTETKGSDAQKIVCFVIAFPSGMKAFVPVDAASRTLRHLSSKAEAESDLAILRQEGVEPDSRVHRVKVLEREKVMKTGTREEIALLLRRLYAGKVPVSAGDSVAIRALEDLVLEEISLVLGIPRIQLENEMRERYGSFAEKKPAQAR
jgi:RNA polymerase-interacting CarD/CdnL/TRCF family regulator